MSLDHRNVQIKYHDKPNDLPIDLRVPLQVETVNDLKCLLKASYLFNPRTQYKCVYIYPKDPMVDTKALGLSEELDRNITKLCEEMSALKASNESEVKALKAQLKSSNDTMKTMVEKIEILDHRLLTSDKRCTVNDFSSKSSPIGSHNQLTTNSDKIRDEINIQEMLTEIKNQNKITFNFMRGLIRDKENKDMRVLAEDTDDSEFVASVGKNFGFK
ncbi:unnamed protein product [Medioppia subpectinata]|uniref:Uncharacterized protein n=1 Tax=Medioppia subpectinata TaxID=1979941 RepID=A0A7R9KV71_9ACAR|nr:unnamed protein product [Medioppia subpectinata]CAG2109276.1 unnamed protein product [Medioppia subpectinata]